MMRRPARRPRITLALLTCGLGVTTLAGQSIWVKFGNQVFQGAGDARSVALSEAEVASATGPLAVMWNPARLFANEERSVIIAHQERFSGFVTFDIVGFDLKGNFNSKLSVVLIREGVQEIPNTTHALLYKTETPFPLDDPSQRIVAESVTYFNQVQWAAVVGAATSRGEWMLGGSAKILMHQLGTHTGYGIGFDLGVYRSFLPRNTVGLTLRDATTSWVVWDEGTVERTAPQFLVGNVQTVPVPALNVELKVMATAVINLAGRTNPDDFSLGSMGGHLRVGLEIQYKERFHLRMGRNPLTGYSTGLGLGFVFGEIDYAFVPSPSGTLLGNSHYVSLNLRLSFLHSVRDKLDD